MSVNEPMIQEKSIRKSRTKSQKKLVLIIVAAFALVAVAGLLLAQPKSESYTVKAYTTATVAAKDMRNTISASGTVEVRTSEDVVTLQSGFLGSVTAEEGDTVKKGQVLAIIQSKDLENSLIETQAQLASSKRSLEKLNVEQQYSIKDFDRNRVTLLKAIDDAVENVAETKRLFAADAATAKDLKTAQDKETSARAALDAADANRDKSIALYNLNKTNSEADIAQQEDAVVRLNEKIAQCTITAPFDATVLNTYYKQGAYVSQYNTLFHLAVTANPRIVLDVSEDSVGSVKKGMKVAVVAGSSNYSGTVESIGLEAQTNSSTSSASVSVYVKLEGSVEGLIPGSSATGEIELGVKTGALVLPRGSYLSTGNQSFVYKLVGNKAIKTDVTYGLIQATEVEIATGLSAGDVIITSGYQDYADMAEVDLSATGGTK